MAKPKKKDLVTAGIRSLNPRDSNTLLKYRAKETSPLMFSTRKDPYKANASPRITKRGSISIVAKIRVTTKNLNGLVPDTSMASICSVTLIDPSSAPIPEATRPAQIRATITGPISLTIEIPTMLGIQETAPNSSRVGLVCKVSTSPMMNPVILTKGKDLFPTL